VEATKAKTHAVVHRPAIADIEEGITRMLERAEKDPSFRGDAIRTYAGLIADVFANSKFDEARKEVILEPASLRRIGIAFGNMSGLFKPDANSVERLGAIRNGLDKFCQQTDYQSSVAIPVGQFPDLMEALAKMTKVFGTEAKISYL